MTWPARSTPDDPASPAARRAEAEAHDHAAPWRVPRLLDLVGLTAAVQRPANPAGDGEATPPRRMLVLEPGRGRFGRALADRLDPADTVVAIVGTPRDDPAAPGGGFDEAFVERRGHAASVDIRDAGASGWPLRDPEEGTFDLVVVAGGLAWRDAAGQWLDACRRALAPAGQLLLIDDDAAALHIHPPLPRFESAWRHRLTRRAIQGRDDAAIRRLPERLDRHRMRAVAAGIASHGGLHGEPDFDAIVRLLSDLMLGGDDEKAANGEPSAADEAIEALERWRRRPGATIWWPLLWVIGESV
jgi:SAM-dependent methyltransferase